MKTDRRVNWRIGMRGIECKWRLKAERRRKAESSAKEIGIFNYPFLKGEDCHFGIKTAQSGGPGNAGGTVKTSLHSTESALLSCSYPSPNKITTNNS